MTAQKKAKTAPKNKMQKNAKRMQIWFNMAYSNITVTLNNLVPLCLKVTKTLIIVDLGSRWFQRNVLACVTMDTPPGEEIRTRR